MKILAKLIFGLFRLIFKSKRDLEPIPITLWLRPAVSVGLGPTRGYSDRLLIFENLALRQQLAVLKAQGNHRSQFNRGIIAFDGVKWESGVWNCKCLSSKRIDSCS